MSDLTKGYTFTAGEVVTPAKLHALVDNANLNAASVGTTELADGSVTTAKLASGIAVVSSQIALASGKVLIGGVTNFGAEVPVDAGTMATSPAFGVKDYGIDSPQIKDGSVSAPKITDKNVTLAKLQDIGPGTVIGRGVAGTGPPELLTAGAGISISNSQISATVTPILKSAKQTVSLAGVTGVLVTATHGLGGAPVMAALNLECIVNDSANSGYVVGDIISGNVVIYDGSDYDVGAFWWVASATDLRLGRIALATAGQISIPNKTSGVFAPIASGNESRFAVTLILWR